MNKEASNLKRLSFYLQRVAIYFKQGANIKPLFFLLFFTVGLVFLGEKVFAEVNCSGNQIFTEKKCTGDDVNSTEKELVRLVNEYRAQNNLPPLPLSQPLSIVANRHLSDIIFNLKTLTHSWSNCQFNLKDSATWNCVFESPSRLKVQYSGHAFENLYRNNGGNAIPKLALEAWKKSTTHNALILNLENWKEAKFDAVGVAVNGQYASLWLGLQAEPENNLVKNNSPGLGVTFEKAVSGLTKVISIKQASSTGLNEQWTGSSSDKTVLLEVIGTREDVAQATISIKIKLEKNSQISAKNRNVLDVFLKNLASEWNEREIWATTAISNLQQNPKTPQTIIQGNKIFTFTVDAQNYLSLTVKPRPMAREVK